MDPGKIKKNIKKHQSSTLIPSPLHLNIFNFIFFAPFSKTKGNI